MREKLLYAPPQPHWTPHPRDPLQLRQPHFKLSSCEDENRSRASLPLPQNPPKRNLHPTCPEYNSDAQRGAKKMWCLHENVYTAPPSCPHTAQDDIRWLLTSRTLYMQNVPFPFPGFRDFSQKHSMTRPPPSERSKQWTGCPESRDPLDKSSEVASRLNAELARRH